MGFASHWAALEMLGPEKFLYKKLIKITHLPQSVKPTKTGFSIADGFVPAALPPLQLNVIEGHL